jgi:hypothetical protein
MRMCSGTNNKSMTSPGSCYDALQLEKEIMLQSSEKTDLMPKSRTHQFLWGSRTCSDRLCSVLLCSEAHSDRKHRLHVQKPSEHKTQFPLPLKPSHRHYCLNTSVLLCGIFPTHQTSYNLSDVHSLSVVHSLSIILGILGFKLVIICGSFQSLVIVSDILSWCVLHGPCQCNIFFI